MSNYGAIEECENFPKIDAQACEDYTNKLFTPYLFFKRERKHIELVCSCCRHSGAMDYIPRLITYVEQMILEGHHNEYAVCPWCRQEVQLKEIGRLGQRKNLLEYHPIIFFSARDGELYCRAYWARKDYLRGLDDAPTFMLSSAYRFSVGKASLFYEGYDGKIHSTSIEGNYDPVHRVITEPFVKGSWMAHGYEPYAVYGLEEAVQQTPFKYCGYDSYGDRYQVKWGTKTIWAHNDAMKYFAACCIYPRQIEMLMKNGLDCLVYDLVSGRKKNAATFNWKKDSFTEAFGLSKQELRQYRESAAEPYDIARYKKLKRAGIPESFDSLRSLSLPIADEDEFIKLCCKIKVRVSKFAEYLLEQHISGPDFDPDLPWKVVNTYELYKDYLNMAGLLGWELEDKTVLMPKELYRRHDEASIEINQKVMNEASEIVDFKLAERCLKYNFEQGDYFIRCALSAEEIVREGKNLKHCVGGYAQRHMSGAVTILFLRKKDEPNKSLYTVEMRGNRLQQIHGFENDRGRAQPKDSMEWFLNPWLDWIKAGSKRDAEGRPKLPKKKGAKTA